MAPPFVDTACVEARVQKLIASIEYLAADAAAAGKPYVPVLLATSSLLQASLLSSGKCC